MKITNLNSISSSHVEPIKNNNNINKTNSISEPKIDRVAYLNELKHRIQEGSFEVSSKAISEKILENSELINFLSHK